MFFVFKLEKLAILREGRKVLHYEHKDPWCVCRENAWNPTVKILVVLLLKIRAWHANTE